MKNLFIPDYIKHIQVLLCLHFICILKYQYSTPHSEIITIIPQWGRVENFPHWPCTAHWNGYKPNIGNHHRWRMIRIYISTHNYTCARKVTTDHGMYDENRCWCLCHNKMTTQSMYSFVCKSSSSSTSSSPSVCARNRCANTNKPSGDYYLSSWEATFMYASGEREQKRNGRQRIGLVITNQSLSRAITATLYDVRHSPFLNDFIHNWLVQYVCVWMCECCWGNTSLVTLAAVAVYILVMNCLLSDCNKEDTFF